MRVLLLFINHVGDAEPPSPVEVYLLLLIAESNVEASPLLCSGSEGEEER